MKVLLDTNVISELNRPGASEKVRNLVASFSEENQFISAVSIGEIVFGVSRLEPGKRRSTLQAWLESTIRQFADNILPADVEVTTVWGQISAASAKKGRPLTVTDGLIAATAVHHGLVLLTRDIADFSATPVTTLNPWK